MSATAITLLSVLSLLASSRPDLLRSLALPQDSGWVEIEGGVYRPLYKPSEKEAEVRVPSFELAKTSVTNREFLEFVQKKPQWQRDRVSTLYADGRYLEHWAAPLELGEAAGADHPVVNVSWFAARAFCRERGGRLPTEAEWEYAATEPGDAAKVLRWYAAPAGGPGRPVRQEPPNGRGVYDLHGLVWEWVSDFNSSLVISDNRSSGERDLTRFCGGGALKAGRTDDYAAFMRSAFRSSLEAKFVGRHLGFRCARDA
jgi:formylglycine-generating enzyme